MDDEEWLTSMSKPKPDWQYHEICLWLPHKTETVDDITEDMVHNGFRIDRKITTYEGKILDGRHRYEAALQANVDPVFVEFQGTREEAISYVTSENVARRHLNSQEKEYFYVQRAEALGVQTRGGNGNNQHQSGNVVNTTIAPSQKDHADALGVHRDTVARWEKDRKEIMADPELSEKATTLEGYKDAKKELRSRNFMEEREEIRDRKQKEMEEAPKNFDLDAYIKSTEHCEIGMTARCMVVMMEQLVSKFDKRDILANLYAAIRDDIIGVKIPALHEMADILTELCDDLPVQETNLIKLN